MKKARLVQLAIFAVGIAIGAVGALGLWQRLRPGGNEDGPSDVLPAPEFDTEGRVAAKFREAIRDFCEHEYTREYVFKKYAPGGVTPSGAGQVPSPQKASFSESEMHVSLVTPDAATRVVWWMKPERGDVIDELHVVPDASARIVDYEKFVKDEGLGPGRRLEQSAALGEVPHLHVVKCSSGEISVTLQQIVEVEGFVGKMGEMTLTKGDPTNPRQRRVLTPP